MKLEHRFVEFIPKELDDNVLYISIRFTTAVHKCPCGCGIKTVTPLSPTDWKLTFNGKSVSIYPSIGNWGFPCRSHYWITKNEVIWSNQWSDEEIFRGRELNNQNKSSYYNNEKEIVESPMVEIRNAQWWKFKWLFKSR